MSTYYEKLRDPRWQKRRLEIMQRDGFKCRDCGAVDKTLNVHHCHYAKTPWDADERALLTVCEDCHGNRQKMEDSIRQNLGVVLAKLKNGPDDIGLSSLFTDMKTFADNTDPETIFVVWDYRYISRVDTQNVQLMVENQTLRKAL